MDFYYDRVDRDVLILSADGGLMADNTSRFVHELERFIELGARKLIIDCTRLTQISSMGVGMLVTVHKRMAKKGGDVKLAGVTGVVGKVIRMTGLGAMLQIYPTVRDARHAFGRTKDDDPVDSKHPHLD